MRLMLLYFDTSIFLRWFKERDEENYQECMEGIAAIMDGLKSKKLQIVTSTATMAEIMPKRTGEDAYKDIASMLEYIEVRPVDIRIAKLAGYLRDAFYRDNSSGNRDKDSKLRTMDAMHLATAIYAQADYLCTSDNPLKNLDKKLIDEVIDREIVDKGSVGKGIKIVEPPVLEIGKMLIP